MKHIDPEYRVTYQEIDYYGSKADQQRQLMAQEAEVEIMKLLAPAMSASQEAMASFPEPWDVWIDAVHDGAAQLDAYRHIAPVAGKKLLQLGGTGIHAIKAVRAGAEEAWLLTPVLGEALLASSVARQLGLADRLHCIVGVGEKLPFHDRSLDAIISGGCLHHTETEYAIAECARILRAGGKFAAWDPWEAPFYGIGTRIFGKRDIGINCRPITAARVEALRRAFDSAIIIQHGAITRYLLIALGKMGIDLGRATVWRINRIDDRVSSWIPGLHHAGSSVALLGATRGPV